jgi:hypothetical protein
MVISPRERQSAEEFLKGFESADANEGEKKFAERVFNHLFLIRNGKVEAIPIEQEWIRTRKWRTDLLVQKGAWKSICTCNRERCEHAYAAMLVLLEIVQIEARAVKPKVPEESIEPILQAKLGRKLTAD